MATEIICTQDGVIDLWIGRPGHVPFDGSQYVLSLSTNEVRRAGRFRPEALATQWVAHRIALRQILSAYTGVSPENIEFDTTCRLCGDSQHGKPRVVQGAKLSFSAAHCGGALLVGISADSEIGVDLEAVRPHMEPLARQICTEPELTRLTGEPDVDRALIRLWVQKEALVKGCGLGLAKPMSEVYVGVSPGPRTATTRMSGSSWWVREYQFGPSLYGAVASALPTWDVRMLMMERALGPRSFRHAVTAFPPIIF